MNHHHHHHHQRRWRQLSRKPPLPEEKEEEGDEEIDIYLKVIKTMAMKVKKSDTMGHVKSAFCEKEDIAENGLELFLNGDRLKDDKTVMDYGIQKGSTLHMILQFSDRMKLSIVVPSLKKNILVEARSYDSIRYIKSMILEKEKIQPNDYNLLYAGKLLEDDLTLASLNMERESILLLVFIPKDTLSFSVMTPAGISLDLKVKFLYSVSDVKSIVGGLTGILDSDYDLIYEGKKLEDSKFLAFYNIMEGCILEMSWRSFPIFFKPWSGKTISFSVHKNDLVEDVKKQIFNKLGAPNYCISILYGGKVLDVDRDLAYYNIQKNATLHMGRPFRSLSAVELLERLKFLSNERAAA